ncbi:enoyl-CoA hydratase/isomerase family protein [Nonomuraea pusilla]|uniref:enoyl-CoA hydratase n=1 Tax=Nonomuraea pusilla TaxID=46177 RepID=A0A1H8BZD6_9ACTN|nr:enoyl-CoA hydratase-related protein [Nonomuraea pusilla]SEM88291.1 short chain enoyl-CoA hydratase [Nonomuraea pusilla]
MGEYVSVEVADQIATIRLDRPKMNALSSQVQQELTEAARLVDADPEVQAVILYGGEKVFAAGVDVKEMADMSYADMSAHSRTLQACFAAVAAIGQPVIAAVTGYALGGGCELALCADFRVAGESARLGQPEIQLGLIPGAGGTQRLPRLVGPARAKDLIFTGRHVPAPEALAMGLVDRVVPDEQVYTAALEWAATFVGGPAVALRAAKQAVDRGMEVDLESGLEIERLQFSGLFATDDARAGMRAFAEKTKPKFTGR